MIFYTTSTFEGFYYSLLFWFLKGLNTMQNLWTQLFVCLYANIFLLNSLDWSDFLYLLDNLASERLSTLEAFVDHIFLLKDFDALGYRPLEISHLVYFQVQQTACFDSDFLDVM